MRNEYRVSPRDSISGHTPESTGGARVSTLTNAWLMLIAACSMLLANAVWVMSTPARVLTHAGASVYHRVRSYGRTAHVHAATSGPSMDGLQISGARAIALGVSASGVRAGDVHADTLDAGGAGTRHADADPTAGDANDGTPMDAEDELSRPVLGTARCYCGRRPVFLRASTPRNDGRYF